MAEASTSIIEPTTATFEQDVILRSQELLVIVDFWAPWCQPCQQLAPVLEKLAQQHADKLILAKVNVDESGEIAMAFGVQSIPHVVAVRDGQPINQFQGLLSEEELQQWLESMLPTPADDLVEKGLACEQSDPTEAERCYREALSLTENQDAIKVHLARVLMAQNRLDEASQSIAELQQRGFLEPEAEKIKSQLELRTAAADTGGVAQARASAEAAPEDLSLQLKLADALAVDQQHEQALEICLSLVKADKAEIGAEAKQTAIRIFDLLGPESELVSTYRRKLATLLY